jgi:antitoxin ParD1/3/4
MNTKIAVSVPEDLVETAHQAVAHGQAKSVSAYVAAALDHYRRQQTLDEFLADLDAEFGPVPLEVQQQVDAEIERIAGPALKGAPEQCAA